MGVEGENRAGAVFDLRDHIDPSRLVLLKRDVESLCDEEIAHIMRRQRFVTGRILRVDRNESGKLSLHSTDVGRNGHLNYPGAV